jgi:hypothetical protein
LVAHRARAREAGAIAAHSVEGFVAATTWTACQPTSPQGGGVGFLKILKMKASAPFMLTTSAHSTANITATVGFSILGSADIFKDHSLQSGAALLGAFCCLGHSMSLSKLASLCAFLLATMRHNISYLKIRHESIDSPQVWSFIHSQHCVRALRGSVIHLAK